MRLFVALYPSPEALDDITEQVSRLRIGEVATSGVNVRLAARETLHVTLVFLGEVDDARLPDVEAALGRAANTWRRPTQATVPPRLQLGGGGRFGRGRFTVLWVGVNGDLDALRALSRASRRELRRARLPYDRRPYRPHLTLARPGDRLTRAAIDEDRETLAGYLGPSWPVAEMVLVRSHLGPRPLYHRLAAWPLGRDPASI